MTFGSEQYLTESAPVETKPKFPFWLNFKESVTGSSHVRSEKPNQDSVAVYQCDSGTGIIASVADGHGSKKCFRSNLGSTFATESAIECLKIYLTLNRADEIDLSSVRQEATFDLPIRIVRHWRQMVDCHLIKNPFSKDDLNGLSAEEINQVQKNPRATYGTTLVATLLCDSFCIYLQLGDGEILVLPKEKSAPVKPLPSDPRSFANETASLGTQDDSANSNSIRPHGGGGPWADFRVKVLPLTALEPELVLLTTDGYPNAFVDDASFTQALIDIREIRKSNGWDTIQTNFPIWLQEASRQGSGDDVSVVLIQNNHLGNNSALGSPTP